MLDTVFWKQVESAWSKDSRITLVKKEEILNRTVKKETVDQMMDFRL